MNENEKSFKDKIKKHIEEQIKKDNEYDRLIKEKSNKSKIIYKLKNYVTNKTHLKNELNEINKLERQLRNIELTDIKLQSINSKLEQIYKDSYNQEKKNIEQKIELALNSNEENEDLQKKNENKKILNEYQNKLEKLEKKEDDYITKFDKLIKILEEMKNSEIKEFFDEDNNETIIYINKK